MKIDRLAIFNKCNGHCAYCGCEITVKKFQVDHLWPKYGGGLNDENNLLPACCSCNNYKSTFTLELFRSQIMEQSIRLHKTKPTFRLAERFGQIVRTPKPVVFYFEKLLSK